MRFSISRTRIWKALDKHAWLNIVALTLIYVFVALMLGIEYALASKEGHLQDARDPPAISELGDKMPEHAIFIVGIICKKSFLRFLLLCFVVNSDST